MSNERNLISDQAITNRAPVRNQDNKHAKKASDGTMTFMVWSITGTALAACSGPIFGDGTSIGGGGGRSSGRGGIPITENGPAVPIADTQFGSVPEAGGVYIKAEVENEAGTAQAAEIMFRPEDGSGDVTLLSRADGTGLGAPATPAEAIAPTDFVDRVTPVGAGPDDVFYFVSAANIVRLVLGPEDYDGDESDFDIRFLVYDGADGTFADDIATATLESASTVAVAFEAVDDPVRVIALDGAQTVTSLAENADTTSRTRIADLRFTDNDETPSDALDIVVTDTSVSDSIIRLFEIDGNVLYLRAGASLDYETFPALPIRVQSAADSTIGVNISVAVTDVVETVGPMEPVANIAPTSTKSASAATIANDEDETVSTIISFDDTDSNNDALAIRGVAFGGRTEPDTLDYVSTLGSALNSGETEVMGMYGMFTIERRDATDDLAVTYNLDEDNNATVSGLSDGAELFEKLTVYVNDGEDTSVVTYLVTIRAPQNGYYHLPATGVARDRSDEGATSYSVDGISTAVFSAALRQTTHSHVNSFDITIDEDTGAWSASIRDNMINFVIRGDGESRFAEREFYIHAHNGDGRGDNLGNPEKIMVTFNKMFIIADGDPDADGSVVDLRLATDVGTSNHELFIGTDGVDNIGMTLGGTDAIFAREGDDTFTLGRNDSDTIYHRFSSSGTDWTNTDESDTISNYVRSGANVANDTFIFVDIDPTDVVSEDDFIGNDNIRFYATLIQDGTDLKIESFEIHFVDPNNRGTEESTITINYNTGLRPDITTNEEKEAFGLPDEDTGTDGIQVTAGAKEIVDGTKWSHYFGDTPDAFQVIDDGDLPTAIDHIVNDL